jgi:hypothetical protein
MTHTYKFTAFSRMNETFAAADFNVKQVCEKLSDSPLFLGVCLLAFLSELMGLSNKTQANGVLHFTLKALRVLARVMREANNEPDQPPPSQPQSRKASVDSARPSGTVPTEDHKD